MAFAAARIYEGEKTWRSTLHRRTYHVPILTGIKLNESWPNRSHDNPADPKPVISFALYKSNKLNSQNRVASGHVHDDATGHINFPSKYKQYRAITGMEYKPPGSGTSCESSQSMVISSAATTTAWEWDNQQQMNKYWDGSVWIFWDTTASCCKYWDGVNW